MDVGELDAMVPCCQADFYQDRVFDHDRLGQGCVEGLYLCFDFCKSSLQSSDLINLASLSVSIMSTRPKMASTACCGVIFSCFAIILMFSVLILFSFSEGPLCPAPGSCRGCLQTDRRRHHGLWIQIWIPVPSVVLVPIVSELLFALPV